MRKELKVIALGLYSMLFGLYAERNAGSEIVLAVVMTIGVCTICYLATRKNLYKDSQD